MKKLILVTAAVLTIVAGQSVHAETFTFEGIFDQRIPAQSDGHAWMDPVELFADKHLTITDLDVYLKIDHTEVSDLAIYLDAPTGQTIILKNAWAPLMNNPRVNIAGATFDDDASLFMVDGLPPYTGCFRPALGQSLAVFNGIDAFGQWTLRIEDVFYDDIGALKNLTLIIDTPHAPEPATLSAFMLLSLLAIRRSPKLLH